MEISIFKIIDINMKYSPPETLSVNTSLCFDEEDMKPSSLFLL